MLCRACLWPADPEPLIRLQCGPALPLPLLLLSWLWTLPSSSFLTTKGCWLLCSCLQGHRSTCAFLRRLITLMALLLAGHPVFTLAPSSPLPKPASIHSSGDTMVLLKPHFGPTLAAEKAQLPSLGGTVFPLPPPRLPRPRSLDLSGLHTTPLPLKMPSNGPVGSRAWAGGLCHL